MAPGVTPVLCPPPVLTSHPDGSSEARKWARGGPTGHKGWDGDLGFHSTKGICCYSCRSVVPQELGCSFLDTFARCPSQDCPPVLDSHLQEVSAVPTHPASWSIGLLLDAKQPLTAWHERAWRE